MGQNLLRKCNHQFHLPDAAVTVKLSQGHQNWYADVKLNRGYYHPKFETSHLILTTLQIKDNGKVLVKCIQEMHKLPPLKYKQTH